MTGCKILHFHSCHRHHWKIMQIIHLKMDELRANNVSHDMFIADINYPYHILHLEYHFIKNITSCLQIDKTHVCYFKISLV